MTCCASKKHVSCICKSQRTENMCQNFEKNMKTMHFMHFFDDKCPCLANQFWEIHVQHRKMEQKHWKQRTVGPCFAIWSKNSNFLTFLCMEMTCFSCKKMHRIFQDSLRNAKNGVKYWKKQENDAIWAFFSWFEHKTATSTYATCPFSMIIFWIFPSRVVHIQAHNLKTLNPKKN